MLAGVIPVIGPAIAGGTLGIMLSNAAAGAGIAGLIGALVGAGIPEYEATYYQDELRRDISSRQSRPSPGPRMPMEFSADMVLMTPTVGETSAPP